MSETLEDQLAAATIRRQKAAERVANLQSQLALYGGGERAHMLRAQDMSQRTQLIRKLEKAQNESRAAKNERARLSDEYERQKRERGDFPIVREVIREIVRDDGSAASERRIREAEEKLKGAEARAERAEYEASEARREYQRRSSEAHVKINDLKRRLRMVTEALEFYAKPSNYDEDGAPFTDRGLDRGEWARDVLGELA